MSPFRGVARMILTRAVATAQQQAGACTSSALAGGAQQIAALQRHHASSTMGGWMHQSHRGISSSFATFNKLPSLLDAEIKYEKEAYAKAEAVAAGPPAPFVLSDSAGDTMLTLSRSFGNNEQISVDLHVNNQPATPDSAEPEEGEDEELSTVIFNVHVTKGDASLVFECESDGLFVAINHMSHETKGVAASESTYTGPVFEELDDALQAEMRNYLAERGITAELGEYLRHLVYDKEVREYQAWLQRVADFLKK